MPTQEEGFNVICQFGLSKKTRDINRENEGADKQ